MVTLEKTKALLLGLAIVLLALGVIESLLGIGRAARADVPFNEAVLAVTVGLEIISGNDRVASFGPILKPVLLTGSNLKLLAAESDRATSFEPTEGPALAGIRVKDAGTQVAF